MKCPKCGYVSHDYLDACRKCSIDLIGFKAQMQIYSIKAGDISLASLLSDTQSTFATATGLEEPFFGTSMLVDSNTEDDFDISLDNDLNISPISISIVDESLDASKLKLPSQSDAEESATPSASAPDEHDGLGPPQSGYATIMLDVSDFESKLSELESPTAPHATDASDVEMPVDNGDADLLAALSPVLDDAERDNSESSIAPQWDEDPMATVDTRAIESPFSPEPIEDEPTQMPEVSIPLEGPASDVYELLDADVSRIDFDDAIQAPIPPTADVACDDSEQGAALPEVPELSDFNLDSDPNEASPIEVTQFDEAFTQELLPDLPDISTENSAAIDPDLEAETFVDAFDTQDAEAVMPDLPLADVGDDEPEDVISHNTTIVEDGTSATWASEDDDVDQPSGQGATIKLDVDPFMALQATDHDLASNDPAAGALPTSMTPLEDDGDKASDAHEQTDMAMPPLEDNDQQPEPPSAEFETMIDEDYVASGQMMPDIPDLSFDSDESSEESTLVDDVLASDLGLNFSEDDFELPNVDLPCDWAEDADESPSQDENAKPDDTP